MSIGEEIRRWRSVRRITMPQLSEAVGAPASTIYLWEKNRVAPSTQEISALAKALGISASQLTGVSPPVSPEKKSEPPHRNETPAAPEPERAGGFDMMLVTKVYHSIRDEVESATSVELATARNLLQESLKIVKARIKEQNDRKRGNRP